MIINSEISNFFKYVATNGCFRGACACDQIPNLGPGPALIIVNTVCSKRGEHKIVIGVDKNDLWFFDSFGRPPASFNDGFNNYIPNFASKYSLAWYNSHSLQNFNSKLCEFYCYFFIMRIAQGFYPDDIIIELKNYANKDRYVEDQVVMEYQRAVGMISNLDIERYFKFITPNSLFKGVYPCDQIPDLGPTPGWIIVNTAPSYTSGQHWIVLGVAGNLTTYFDPLAFPPASFNDVFAQNISNFISKYPNHEIFHNPDRVQDTNSKLCGFFCIFYIMRIAEGFCPDDIIKELKYSENCDKYFKDEVEKKYQMSVKRKEMCFCLCAKLCMMCIVFFLNMAVNAGAVHNPQIQRFNHGDNISDMEFSILISVFLLILLTTVINLILFVSSSSIRNLKYNKCYTFAYSSILTYLKRRWMSTD